MACVILREIKSKEVHAAQNIVKKPFTPFDVPIISLFKGWSQCDVNFVCKSSYNTIKLTPLTDSSSLHCPFAA